MTDPTPNLTPELNPDSPDAQEPFIPPQYLLYIAVAAFLVALVVALTQPTFGVVGYGGLAFGILALLGWIFMAPDQARAALSGRTARFGGLSVIVTLVLIVAMVLVYILARNANVRVDLTQRDTFSLTESARQAITTLGADPTTPPVRILAFYGPGQAARRDQDTVLFDDYVAKSGGKIDYEFIDPNRSPQVAQQYNITRDGQIAVAALDDGQPDAANAELVQFFSQDELTNAILKVSAAGDFRAYFMNVEGGLTPTPSETGSISQLNDALAQFDWDVQTLSFLDLTRPETEITLNDPAADGEVMIISGGSQPLTAAELEVIRNYVNSGGSLVIFAGNSLNEDQASLASGENLSSYLWESFGVRFRNDVVIDPVQAFQSPLRPVATDISRTSFITTNGTNPNQSAVVFEVPHSIEVNDTLPENVSVETLIRSSDGSYSKTDLEAILDQNIDRAETDLEGPLVLGAAAENRQTGARVVLFGSTSLVNDVYSLLQGADNLTIGFNSLIWTTQFDEFFAATTMISDPSPQDTPIFADAQTQRTVNFLTLILLPFGVLFIGIWILWNNRERERATR